MEIGLSMVVVGAGFLILSACFYAKTIIKYRRTEDIPQHVSDRILGVLVLGLFFLGIGSQFLFPVE